MSMSPEDFEQIQYTRASTMSIDLSATDDPDYPFEIRDRDGQVHKMRNMHDVSEWFDRYEEGDGRRDW